MLANDAPSRLKPLLQPPTPRSRALPRRSERMLANGARRLSQRPSRLKPLLQPPTPRSRALPCRSERTLANGASSLTTSMR